MAFGLRIWRADGALQLDTSSRIAKIKGTFTRTLSDQQFSDIPITGMTTTGGWEVISIPPWSTITIGNGTFRIKNERTDGSLPSVTFNLTVIQF